MTSSKAAREIRTSTQSRSAVAVAERRASARKASSPIVWGFPTPGDPPDPAVLVARRDADPARRRRCSRASASSPSANRICPPAIETISNCLQRSLAVRPPLRLPWRVGTMLAAVGSSWSMLIGPAGLACWRFHDAELHPFSRHRFPSSGPSIRCRDLPGWPPLGAFSTACWETFTARCEPSHTRRPRRDLP